MTNNCDDGCCDMSYEFSEKTIAAIQKYEELMKEYSLGDEFAAEVLVTARIETLNDHSEEDCCDHDHEEEEGGEDECEDDDCEDGCGDLTSPLDIFVQNLFAAANKHKELTDEDVKRISEVVIAVDESALNDLMDLTKKMQAEGVIKEQHDADDEIESPYSK